MTHISLEGYEKYLGRDSVQAALKREKISDCGSYAEFVEQLYQDIDEAIYELQASREMRQTDSEDRITIDLLSSLKHFGYNATHDTKTGGHVDLSIRLGNRHSWIGEAKKDSNFQEGLLQLTTRYMQASGNFSHDHAGLLFYLVETVDALGALNRWKDKLESDGYNCHACTKNKLAINFKHILEGSGTDLHIRSMCVSLYHKPKDKSARIIQAKAAKKTSGKTKK